MLYINTEEALMKYEEFEEILEKYERSEDAQKLEIEKIIKLKIGEYETPRIETKT